MYVLICVLYTMAIILYSGTVGGLFGEFTLTSIWRGKVWQIDIFTNQPGGSWF